MKALRICFGMLLLAATSWSQQYVISTVAGGAPPPTPQQALTALIGRPAGIAVDSSGNVYFSTSFNCVFELSPTGVVTRIAGASRNGYSGDGGAATLAQLSSPNGLAVDGAGNIYIADASNSSVRKISNGIITTVLGSGTLQAPQGVAVDTHGNLYIADTNNNRIREFSTIGVVTTVAGTGTAGSSGDGGLATGAQLSQPQYVAVDSSGNVFISDTGNNRVRKVSSSGVITTLAGTGTAGFSGDGAAAMNAQLNMPEGVAVDKSGNVFIVDSNNNRIRQVSAAGIITTVAGSGANGLSGDGGVATSAQLNSPYGVAVDAAGDLFIADYYNLRVREVSANNAIITTLAGSGVNYTGDNGPATSAQMSPSGVAADGSGIVYIADNSGARKVTPNGVIATFAGTGACCGPGTSGVAATSTEISPERVTLDSLGNVYISDFFNIVHKVSTSGIITTIAGNSTAGSLGDGGLATTAELANPPGGVAVDAHGNLYIADTNNHRIRKVSTTGIITTVAGNGTAGFAGDGGPAASAQLNTPFSVAVDASGNLYIADFNNHRIRKVVFSAITAAGVITTLAGNGTAGYSGDGGLATSAQLYGPQSVIVDPQGNVFIADTLNNRVREVASGANTTSGIITTIAGNGGYAYSGDCGPATSAQLAYPGDVAVDGLGNIYITDTNNNAIRKLQPTGQPAGCAVPSISTLSPASAAAGGPAFTLTVNGAGFLPGTVVLWNGSPLTTTFVSSTQLTASAPAGLIASAGSAGIVAVNPEVLSSGPVVLSINLASQTITFTPLRSVTLPSPAFTLTATASSGLTVSFASTTPTVCSVSVATLTPLVPGICTITASQPGNAAWSAAAPVTQSFSILAAGNAVLTFGTEDCLTTGCYGNSDPTAGATLIGLAPSAITDASGSFPHNYPFTPSAGDFPGTDQMYAGSVQTSSHDGYSSQPQHINGPDVMTLNYSSLVSSGQSVTSLTLGIATDDFQFPTIGQPFIAKLNGIANSALTAELNSLNENGPQVHFFTIGLDPALDNPSHTLTVSIDEGGDGGDGWAVDFLTLGVTVTARSSPKPSQAGVFRDNFEWVLDANGNHQTGLLVYNNFVTPQAGDIPVVGDWSGSGTSKIGIYRPSSGTWFLDYNGNGVFDAGDRTYQFGGVQGDLPVVGDWSGSGFAKIGIFRSGFYWILDTNGDGVFDAGDQAFPYGGVAGDVPVTGDWTGDGKAKVGVVRPFFPGGVPAFWILDANNDQVIDAGDLIFGFGGISGDIAVVGDWNGSGTGKAGVYRNGFFWVVDFNGSAAVTLGSSQLVAFGFGGIAGDVPVVGKWAP